MWHSNRKKEPNEIHHKRTKRCGASGIETEIKGRPIANNDGKVRLHETISEAGAWSKEQELKPRAGNEANG